MMITIGDTHGCYYTLLKLLDKINKSRATNDYFSIHFVGDLIDRGRNSYQVVELIRKSNNMFSTLGNHESMLLSCLYNDYDNYGWMKQNGGLNTLKSYLSCISNSELINSTNYIKDFKNVFPQSHMDYIKSFPLCKQTYSEKGDLIISHSYVEAFKTLEHSIEKENIIWNRDGSVQLFPKTLHVFGHTPNKDVAIYDCNIYGEDVGGIALNIDTGCCYGGKLTAFEVDEFDPLNREKWKFYQEPVDERDYTGWK